MRGIAISHCIELPPPQVHEYVYITKGNLHAACQYLGYEDYEIKKDGTVRFYKPLMSMHVELPVMVVDKTQALHPLDFDKQYKKVRP